MAFRAPLFLSLALLWSAVAARAQVIPFESGGLRYQTLSKNGVTVMFAHMPAHLKDYQILQVGVSNGSSAACSVRPEDFTFERSDGTRLFATPAKTVVDDMLARATRGDVIKLIATYENSLNGVSQFRSTNGYEARRQSFLAELGSAKLKAAAAASAIAFVATKLAPGESTDGAVFFQTSGKPLGPGRVVARTASRLFEFEPDTALQPKPLAERP